VPKSVSKPTALKLPPGTAIAALVFELGGDAAGYPEGCNAQVFPDGQFHSDDGRPARLTDGELRDWVMSAEVATSLIERLRASRKPILYDYEHRSLWGDSLAAGWIDSLVYEAGRGLFAHVDWTPAAADKIGKKEYRYSSPCFLFDQKTGAIIRLLSVALTNNPALGDLGAVGLTHFLSHEEADMTDQTVTALTVERDTLKTQLAGITAERDGLKGQVVTLTAQVTELQQAQATAQEAAEKAERAELVAKALEDGRLVPALEVWAAELSLADLKKYLEKAAPLSIVDRQSGGKRGQVATLTADELAMCKKMDVTPEDFVKARDQDQPTTPADDE